MPKGPPKPEPPSDTTHVAALPSDHVASPHCPCHPIQSRIGLVDIWVHRLDDGQVPLGPPEEY